MINKWHNLGGVPLYDLEKFCNLLNELANSPTDNHNHSKIVHAVQLAAKPFLKKNASDESYTQAIASQCFNQIAYLLRVDSQIVQKAICNSIVSFFKSKQCNITLTCNRDSDEQEYQPVSSKFCQTVISKSDVLSTILESIDDSLSVDEITCRLGVLHVLFHNNPLLINNRSKCIDMKFFKASSSLLRVSFSAIRDSNTDFKIRVKHNEIIATISDVLYECLMTGEKKRDFSKISPESSEMEAPTVTNSKNPINSNIQAYTEEIITSLFDIFLFIAKDCPSIKSRKRRNDTLVLLNILVETNATYFISTGIVQQILHFALQPENTMSMKIKITSCVEDFELKKLFWLFINKISSFPAALRTISENNILANFFQFVHMDYSRKVDNSFPWTVAQKYELEQLALDCLSTLTPILLEDFVECHGVTRMILFLQTCLGVENSGTGGGEVDMLTTKTLQSTLTVIRQIVVLDCEPINTEFVDQGFMQLILTELSNRKTISLKHDLEIKQDLLFTLAVLCEYTVERKDILGRDGVILFIEYLNICVSGIHSIKNSNSITNFGSNHSSPESKKIASVPSDEQILIVYVIDCIWSCICGALTVEKMFIERSGIYLLLDALERVTSPVYGILLGCLCEFSENKTALDHIAAWKSSKDGTRNALELFLDIWNEVEGGKSCYSNNSNTDTKQVINEIFETPHGKIFTLVQKLDEKMEKGQGKTLGRELSKKHQIIMTYVKKYLDFKIHDAWCEVDRRLREEDCIKPIPIDEEFIHNTYAERNAKMSQLLDDEQRLEKEQEEQTQNEELNVYERTGTAYFGIEARHRRWQKKLQLTSEHAKLVEESEIRQHMLNESRNAQNIDKSSGPESNVVKHELIFPLKNSTTNHAKILTIDS